MRAVIVIGGNLVHGSGMQSLKFESSLGFRV